MARVAIGNFDFIETMEFGKRWNSGNAGIRVLMKTGAGWGTGHYDPPPPDEGRADNSFCN